MVYRTPYLVVRHKAYSSSQMDTNTILRRYLILYLVPIGFERAICSSTSCPSSKIRNGIWLTSGTSSLLTIRCPNPICLANSRLWVFFFPERWRRVHRKSLQICRKPPCIIDPLVALLKEFSGRGEIPHRWYMGIVP